MMDLSILEKEFACNFNEGVYEFIESCMNYEVRVTNICHDYIQEGTTDDSKWNYLMEDAEASAQASQKTGLAKIIEAIKKFIDSIIQKIKDLFTSKKVQADINDMKKIAESLPKSTTVEVVDIKAIEKINDDYAKNVERILSSPDDPEKCEAKFNEVTEKYKKEKAACRAKKIIIPVGVAVAAASAAALGIYKANKVKSLGDKATAKTQSVANNASKKISKRMSSLFTKAKGDSKDVSPAADNSEVKSANHITNIVTGSTREISQQAVEVFGDVGILKALLNGIPIKRPKPHRRDSDILHDIQNGVTESGSESLDNISELCGGDRIRARLIMIQESLSSD